jgi:hypothetical protein
MASAILVQAGGDVRQAFQLARQLAARDPNGFVAQNLTDILGELRKGKLSNSLDTLIQLLSAGAERPEQ